MNELLPAWPEPLPETHDGYGGCAECEDYERARADAALERLRIAHAALEAIQAVLPMESLGVPVEGFTSEDICERALACIDLPPDTQRTP